MKLALILLLLISILCKAQVNAQSPDQNHAALIIDSINVASSVYMNFIDPLELDSIRIQGKNLQFPNCAIYLTLKDNNYFLKLLHSKLLSLKDISETNIPSSKRHKPVMYALNDQFLVDTTGIRIPSMCLTKVIVTKVSHTPYRKKAPSGSILLMINTNPKWTPPDLSQTYIKGSTVTDATVKKSN